LPSNSDIGTAETVNRFVNEGLLITKDALELLRRSATREIYEKVVSNAVRMAKEERASTVEVKHISAAFALSKVEAAETGRIRTVPFAKDVEPQVELLYNPSDIIPASDSVESRVRYFRSRFERLERILRSRPDFSSATPVKEITGGDSRGLYKTIVMVTKKENRRLVAEDLSGSATLVFPKRASPDLEEKLSYLTVDMVVGLEVRKFQGVLVINDVLLPDVPDTPAVKARVPIVSVLISDLHVGSNFFLEKELASFIEWLSGTKGTASSREIAGSVKYVIVAGDVADGVFVYPRQESELKIVSLEEQYGKAAEMLSKVPDHVHIIIGPGNHDIVRDAAPQPPIPDELLEELASERGNVTLVGSPAQVSLHRVKFLVYHGQSLEDVAASIPSVEYSRPHDGMRLLLRARHVAPVYGGNTQICAEGEDDLVISNKPDVFHAGHVHVAGISSYRGTQIVNSGTWQDTTPYQANLGIRATPATFGVHFMKEGKSTLLALTDVV